ncbi:MAG: MBL fold metallo-hydrolase [Vicinamibacterales bacterium]|nr:MBL fold metallo-hydrolase [Vicinamibacterales bacterium]
MRRMLTLLIVLAMVAMPLATLSGQTRAAGKTLDIYYIDTEGGQATLFVSPAGQTLLVDTGNSGERDLNRILDVLKTAGVTKLDHLWLTHYHGDHYGSMAEIAKRIPVAHFYDHGRSIESDRPNIIAFEKLYPEIIGKSAHTAVKPGDKIAFAGTDVTVVASNSTFLKTPIAKAPGAGRPNPLCASHKPRDESKVDPDNHYSAGFVMQFGAFRTIDLGDLTWSREFELMCPNNPIGTVDLYLTNHHGLDQSGSAAFVHAIHPRVAIMNNGTRKGGAVQTFEILETSPGLEDLWQLHWSYAGAVEHNTPGVKIANLDDAAQLAAIVSGIQTPAPPAGPGGNAAHSPAYYFKVSASTDGSFTVTNSRNGYSKTYAARQ